MSEQEKKTMTEALGRLNELPKEAQAVAVAFVEGLKAGAKIAGEKNQ